MNPVALHVLIHIFWLLRHHYEQRALAELTQLLWALRHGYTA